MTITDRGLTVRLTRDVWQLEPRRRELRQRMRQAAASSTTPRRQSWILADRAGNKVCIASWPDGATEPHADGAA